MWVRCVWKSWVTRQKIRIGLCTLWILVTLCMCCTLFKKSTTGIKTPLQSEPIKDRLKRLKAILSVKRRKWWLKRTDSTYWGDWIWSGNVFQDLNIPDAEEYLVKAKLAHQINTLTQKLGLKTQAEAAKYLGVDQPKFPRFVGTTDRFFARTIDGLPEQARSRCHDRYSNAASKKRSWAFMRCVCLRQLI